jgi:hypothetical protein
MRDAVATGGKALPKDDPPHVTRLQAAAANRVQAHGARARMGLRCLTVRVSDRVVRHLSTRRVSKACLNTPTWLEWCKFCATSNRNLQPDTNCCRLFMCTEWQGQSQFENCQYRRVNTRRLTSSFGNGKVRGSLMKAIRLIALVCLKACIVNETCAAEDLELFLPGNNVSSRPVIEFRARRGNMEHFPDSLGGHTYVLLGRGLDNGNILYNTVAGFYPKNDQASAFAKTFGTPGAVKQELDDAKSEITFKAYITPTQEVAVGKVISRWNDKEYALLGEHCNHLVKDVARVLHLSIPNLKDVFPADLIVEIKMLNTADTPLRAPAPTVSDPKQAPSNPTIGPNPSKNVESGQKTGEGVKSAIPQVNSPIATPGTSVPPSPPSPPMQAPPHEREYPRRKDRF